MFVRKKQNRTLWFDMRRVGWGVWTICFFGVRQQNRQNRLALYVICREVVELEDCGDHSFAANSVGVLRKVKTRVVMSYVAVQYASHWIRSTQVVHASLAAAQYIWRHFWCGAQMKWCGVVRISPILSPPSRLYTADRDVCFKSRSTQDSWTGLMKLDQLPINWEPQEIGQGILYWKDLSFIRMQVRCNQRWWWYRQERKRNIYVVGMWLAMASLRRHDQRGDAITASTTTACQEGVLLKVPNNLLGKAIPAASWPIDVTEILILTWSHIGNHQQLHANCIRNLM